MSNTQIHVVVVTYHPDTKLLAKSILSLRHQVQSITVVDNNSENFDSLRSLIKNYPECDLVSLPENRGLGAAQNTGIKKAVDQGADQILLLDQDSVMEGDSVTILSRSLFRLNLQQKTAAVGPQYKIDGNSVASPFVRTSWFYLGRVPLTELQNSTFVETEFLISSGTLIDADAFRKIGPMDEELFIDHVDTEWCLRARSRNYRLYGVRDAHMSHRLGEQTYRIWLGRWRLLPKHKPFRYYFMFRNSLLLARKPHVPLKWFSAELTKLLILASLCIFAPGQRWQSLRLAAQGIKDGALGRCPVKNSR
ncbi:glycosyltransferase family 2 protein [Microbulbifer hydrolyticus]|uniref:Rhamnosyltransferase n=1 Tax=Microbulbifer hydrolyticus TaxID=48074 RepID=A0A6P1TBH9_9GAMM|nr:glycosyltransferase family 2 protein [Microbulbifer hydrolyticus]MBB5210594.1 rhamnosyltransferase [Microbulbifer hydrolyticus]QHQ38940.1 rhamnosyltransferase [Microbulbifer hydrolyticus]